VVIPVRGLSRPFTAMTHGTHCESYPNMQATLTIGNLFDSFLNLERANIYLGANFPFSPNRMMPFQGATFKNTLSPTSSFFLGFLHPLSDHPHLVSCQLYHFRSPKLPFSYFLPTNWVRHVLPYNASYEAIPIVA